MAGARRVGFAAKMRTNFHLRFVKTLYAFHFQPYAVRLLISLTYYTVYTVCRHCTRTHTHAKQAKIERKAIVVTSARDSTTRCRAQVKGRPSSRWS